MKLKWLSMILLLTMLLGIFAGCTGNGDGSGTQQTTTDNGGGDTTAPDKNGNGEAPKNLMLFAANGDDSISSYRIIYPIGDGACEGKATEINIHLREKIGTTLPVAHDSTPTTEYELVLGDSSRYFKENNKNVTLLSKYKMGSQDFAIEVHDKKIFIAAGSNQALTSAVNYFLDQVVYYDLANLSAGIQSDFSMYYTPTVDNNATLVGTDDNYVNFSMRTGTLDEVYARFSFTGNNGWRIQTKKSVNDKFNDIGASQMLSLSLGEEPLNNVEKLTVEKGDGTVKATAPDGSYAVLKLSPFSITFYTKSNKIASQITNVQSTFNGSAVAGTLEEGEAVYGTGERFNSVNQRGKFIEMYSLDIWSQSSASYMTIPLLCLSRGSGIFINKYEYMDLDLGSDGGNVWSAEIDGGELDVYIFTTEKIADVIYGYSALSGFANPPEEWSYGMIVCRYSPDLNSKWGVETANGKSIGVYEMIAKMEEYDLPWTGILAEAGPGGGKGAKVQDVKELCDYVHSLGKKYLSYISLGYTYETEGFSQSFYITQTLPTGKNTQLPVVQSGVMNPDMGEGWLRKYIDVTNPAANAWYFDGYMDYWFNEIGVDGIKVDFCEQIPENYPLNLYDESIPTKTVHHWYPSAYNTMLYNTVDKKPDGGMLYIRGGGIGLQRAPYVWAGDQERTHSAIQWQLTCTLASGMSGLPFISYDMSGYQYGRGSKVLEQEGRVFVRGTQYTAFTLCMQTHGAVRNSFDFAEEGAAYFTDIYRAYTKLHEVLTPYLNELTEEACTTGMPAMRHLIFGWQDDKNVYDIKDEFTLGDAFLVAPILTEYDSRDIYIPEGTWRDLNGVYNNGESFTVGAEGLTIEDYAADLATLPLFYNENNTSETAETMLGGIAEIFEYLKTIEIPE